MPTSKKHTRRINQMACYLNSVVNSVMAEGDINMLSRTEVASLLRLSDTLKAFEQAKPDIMFDDKSGKEVWDLW